MRFGLRTRPIGTLPKLAREDVQRYVAWEVPGLRVGSLLVLPHTYWDREP